MLKIRLQRVGRKNDPSFRIVAMPHQKDSQSGKIVEILGSYNARAGKPQVNADRVKHWIAMGAQVSGTVHNILVDQKVVAGKKVNVMPKRKPKAEGEKAAEKVVEQTTEKVIEEAEAVEPAPEVKPEEVQANVEVANEEGKEEVVG